MTTLDLSDTIHHCNSPTRRHRHVVPDMKVVSDLIWQICFPSSQYRDFFINRRHPITHILMRNRRDDTIIFKFLSVESSHEMSSRIQFQLIQKFTLIISTVDRTFCSGTSVNELFTERQFFPLTKSNLSESYTWRVSIVFRFYINSTVLHKIRDKQISIVAARSRLSQFVWISIFETDVVSKKIVSDSQVVFIS